MRTLIALVAGLSFAIGAVNMSVAGPKEPSKNGGTGAASGAAGKLGGGANKPKPPPPSNPKR